MKAWRRFIFFIVAAVLIFGALIYTLPLERCTYFDVGTGKLKRRTTFYGVTIGRSEHATRISRLIEFFDLSPLSDTGIVLQSMHSPYDKRFLSGYHAALNTMTYGLEMVNSVTRDSVLEIIEKTGRDFGKDLQRERAL